MRVLRPPSRRVVHPPPRSWLPGWNANAYFQTLQGILARRRPAAPTFVPSDVSSYVDSWTTDMDPASGTLTSWNGDGGNGYNLDDIDGNPQVDVSLDGNNAPSFDGTGDWADGTTDATLANTIGAGADGDYEIWAVSDLTGSDSAGSNYYESSTLFSGSDGWMALAVNGSSGVIHGYSDGVGGDVQCTDSIDIIDGAEHVCRARLESGSVYLRVDDRTEVSTGGIAGYRTHTDVIRVASDYGGVRLLTGTVHVWVFNQPLSTGDRDSMYTYVAATYPSVTVP